MFRSTLFMLPINYGTANVLCISTVHLFTCIALCFPHPYRSIFSVARECKSQKDTNRGCFFFSQQVKQEGELHTALEINFPSSRR